MANRGGSSYTSPEPSWRDNRRAIQVSRITALAMKCDKGVDLPGYLAPACRDLTLPN
jgi:hypothetical protein